MPQIFDMMPKTKILVVGGDSQIGSTFVKYLKCAGESVTATTMRCDTLSEDRIYLNLTDDIERWILPNSVNVVVICAGITSVEACAKDPSGSARVNVEAVSALSHLFIEKGAYIIYLSTNQVFDGAISYPSPGDQISPITEYGKQKAEAEKRLLDSYPKRVAILRLTKVIGSHNPLLEKWAEALKGGNIIRPFSDMFIAPIPVSLVISVMRLVIDRRLNGILHLSGDRDISYAEVARIGGWVLGSKEDQIQPILARESGIVTQLVVTSKTALNMDRLKLELGVMPPEASWTIEQVFKNPKVLDGITN